MYQDPEVAQIIRRLDERKREAVQQERYDYAKKLKQAIADLQKVRFRFEGAAPPPPPQAVPCCYTCEGVSRWLKATPCAHQPWGPGSWPVLAPACPCK